MFIPEKQVTAANRDRLETKLRALQPDDIQAKGDICLQLAYIYKQVGTGRGDVPFEESAKAAAVALDCFRKLDDRKKLMLALRASIVAFVTDADPDTVSRLEEALAIAQELQDNAEIGWSYHALSTHASRILDSERSAHFRALSIKAFKQSDNDRMIGFAFFQEALQDTMAPDQGEMYLQAGEHFERARAYRNAALAFNMALMAVEQANWDASQIRSIARRQILNEQRNPSGSGYKLAKRMLRKYRRGNRSRPKT